MTVYAVERHATPTVAVQVWYRVGSKDDPTGRGGFAHLFEHLMFKATGNQPSESLDRLTEDVGGTNNAFTEDDVTVYEDEVPSSHLEPLLWAESDRMVNLRVDAKNFHSERAVVEEEFRQRVLADPYGRLNYLILPKRTFTGLYGRPGIGSIEDLERASLADVQQFYATHYRPDNATVVIVGDFDPSRLDAWIDKYFGRLPRRNDTPTRSTAAEPPRTDGPKRYTENVPNVPLPAVVLSYLLPGAGSNDAPALQIADLILSSGDSSRLYKSLVYDKQVASEVWSSATLKADAGSFEVGATAATGKSLDTLQATLQSELTRLQTDGPTPAELTKARNQLRTSTLRTRETNAGTASALGTAAVLLANPERFNTDLARLASVTADDVKAVLNRYVTPANAVEVRYGKGPLAATAPQRSAGPLEPAASANGTNGVGVTFSSKPPLPQLSRPTALPTPRTHTLLNGLRVVVVPKRGTGLVSVVVSVRRAGAAREGKAGLAGMTASLLTRGTSARTATQIAEEVEGLGASLQAEAGWDAAEVGLGVLRENLGTALGVLADVVRNPAFRGEEVARRRTEALDELKVSLEEPGTVARYAAARAVFGAKAYGHPAEGTVTSLPGITRAEIASFYAAHFGPTNTVVTFAGDLSADEAFAWAQKFFGDWKKSVVSGGGIIGAIPPLAGRVVVIDKPDAGQAAVVVSRRGLMRTAKDYYAAQVANAVLGDGYSARLNREIRIRQGLAYGAASYFAARREVGPWSAVAQTGNGTAGAVVAAVLNEMRRMITLPPSASELATRKTALTGEYARGLETGGGLAGQAAALTETGASLSELAAYPVRVAAISPGEVQAIARRYLSPEGVSVVVVGDAKRFLPDLRRRLKGRPIVVIPISRLDLDRADLQKPQKGQQRPIAGRIRAK